MKGAKVLGFFAGGVLCLSVDVGLPGIHQGYSAHNACREYA
jgi:hypothetical protein